MADPVAMRGPQGITLRSGDWSETFPIDKLSAKTAFYRQMHDDYGWPKYKQIADALSDPILHPPTPEQENDHV